MMITPILNTGLVYRNPMPHVVSRHAYFPSVVLLDNGEMIGTTVGRILLRDIVPEAIPFSVVNKVMKKKELANLIEEADRRCSGCGHEASQRYAW